MTVLEGISFTIIFLAVLALVFTPPPEGPDDEPKFD